MVIEVDGDYVATLVRLSNVDGLPGKLADLQSPLDHTHQSSGSGVGGKLDHGLALDGLLDDDHTQYFNSARHTKAVHDALGIDADTLDTYHASALEKIANKGAANGYAPLGSDSKVPTTNLPLIATGDIVNFAVSRGVQYYNSAGVTLTNTTETEIGTVTPITFEDTDSVWFWASVVITQYGLNSAKGSGPISIHFRIRRTSTAGTEICGASGLGFGTYGTYFTTYRDPQPVILIGSDIPGGTPGNVVYKLTAQAGNTPDSQSAIVAYRLIMAQAKSR